MTEHFGGAVGMRSADAVDCPITTSGAAPLIVDGFRASGAARSQKAQ